MSGADPTRRIVYDNTVAAYSIGQRLAWSQNRVAALFPLAADDLHQLAPEQEERLDAWLHRFNGLAAMMQDALFKGIGMLEQEDMTDRYPTNRDRANLMEKFGVIRSATGFSSLAMLRNKLAHHYPSDLVKQAERLNEAWAAVPRLLEVMNGALAYLVAKHLIEDPQLSPLSIP